MKKLLTFIVLAALLHGICLAHAQAQLRIIVFGAHPDDAQYKAGGTAAKWVQAGHAVKMVSVTNGDIGHWQSAGGPLVQRRLAEVMKVDAIIAGAFEICEYGRQPSLEEIKVLFPFFP